MGRHDHRHHSPVAGQKKPAAGWNERGSSPVKARWFFRLAALMLVPLLVWGGLEAMLRLVGYGHPTTFFLHRVIKGQDCLVENDQFGWRFFGSAMARAPRVMAVPATKPPETVRIYVLGESAAYGDPQPEFGLPRLLEALLRERYSGVHFEVVNAAMTAINSHVILPIARDCARAQGDIWVLYLGNNEVIGPYGAGSVFGAPAARLGLIRSAIALKATKSGQLLESVFRVLSPRSGDQEEWGGMRMFTHRKFPLDDPRLSTVYPHFRQNLADILRAGVHSHARIVVSTVAVNLKDCSPFASMHRPDLAPGSLAEWNQAYQAAVESQQVGRVAEAIERFRLVARIDDRFAELQFRWAQCCLALGQDDEARQHFTLARDYDALRFRADSRLNDIIRQAAGGREGEGIYLVDAQQALAQQSPHGVTGAELFYEHVHLSFEGNYYLARTIAEKLTRALPETVAIRADPQRPWLTLSECARILAWSGWNRYEATASILRRLNDPPFTFQFDHAEQCQRLREQLEQLRPALSPKALRQAAEDCSRARDLNPTDWVLDQNLSRLLGRLGDLRGAAEALRRVLERLPHDVEAHNQRGISLAQSGQQVEAVQEFEAALHLDHRSVQALDGLGRLLAQQGNTQGAIRHYEKALKLKPNYCESLVNLGLALNGMGKTNAAKARFYQAFQHKPNNPADLNGLARIFFDHGWRADAVTLFTAALALDPLDASAHLSLGITLSALGRTTEAGQQYAEAARLDPGSAEARLRLGLEFAREGRIAEATGEFAEVVRLKPNFLEARANLGIALFKQGRTGEALEQFKAALGIDPGNAIAKQYIQTIQRGAAEPSQ
jgi:tetratricopeptide (TPR) repeat protein